MIIHDSDRMELLVDNDSFDDVLSDLVDSNADPMLILIAREELRAKCEALGIDFDSLL